MENAYADVHGARPDATWISDKVPAGVRASENVVFERVGPDVLKLDVYRPDDDQVRPLMVIVHGGGWESGDRRMEKPLALRLAQIGYVAALVDYRLGPAGRFPNGVDDVKHAIAWLRDNTGTYGIDVNHVAIMGGSAGGHLAALISAWTGEHDTAASRTWWVQAAVDIDGLADFTAPSMLAQQSHKPSSPTRFLGGSFEQRWNVWREASPIYHVNPHSAPTLFIRSTSHSPLLPGRERMEAELRALGIPTGFIVFPDTPHPFWLFDPWQKGIVKDTDNFLRVRLGWPVPAVSAVH
ncbi:monoterpene epsilon-lactone hydrolase [mine drainage metagenome]|uniref:Monoterpene epsilon-lactone hydrolase n=1 Tax=mine drainage metagenome TaxID=410659 RepID=A0A1J5SXY0_9ZZZZ